MWVRTNPNPKHKHVPDCVIRALAIILNKTWYQVYDDLYLLGRWDASVMCHDEVWGHYLHMHGYEQFMLPKACPQCVTIKEFTRYFPTGRYISRYVSMDSPPNMSGHWQAPAPMWNGPYRDTSQSGYDPRYWR